MTPVYAAKAIGGLLHIIHEEWGDPFTFIALCTPNRKCDRGKAVRVTDPTVRGMEFCPRCTALFVIVGQGVANGDPYIYYAQASDDPTRIKIGFSARVAHRLGQLGLELLTAEAGWKGLEKERHRQFAHLREESEWFRAEADLLDHIETVERERTEATA